MPRTRKQYNAPVDEKGIGRRLREFRKQRGLTQVEVAAELDINQSLVSEYEKGAVRLHSALLAGFAKVLGASADAILGISTVAPVHVTARDRRFMKRLDKIDQLPDRQKQLLLGTIDAVLKSEGID